MASRSKGRNSGRKVTINALPLFQGYVDEQPLTEDLDCNDKGAAFVRQKRHHRRSKSPEQPVTPVPSPPPPPPPVRPPQPSSIFPRENYIFVANLSRSMTENYLKQTFNRFGEIVSVSIVCRDSNSQPFAYIAYQEAASAAKAQTLVEVPSSRDPRHIFRVEPRKTFPFRGLFQTHTTTSRPEPLVQNPAVVATASLSNEPGSDWVQELDNFKWRPCAAKYLFRKVTMEDYLVEYIHTQASYRDIESESVGNMIKRLKEFAESKPQNLREMMPPSVSGVVYNQTRDSSDQMDMLNLILAQNKFDIEGDTIRYLNRLSPALAERKLREILVEGLFVYFFAKFCHGPKFRIKLSYYQRSEPIKSTLMAVTGTNDVQDAIYAYFDLYKDLFVFDALSWDLKMTRDYFDRCHKDDLKDFLEEPSHVHPLHRQPEPARPRMRDFFNVEGEIAKIADPARGEVHFRVSDMKFTASFKRKDVYIDGRRMTADMKLSDAFRAGDAVHLSANVGSQSGQVTWTCTHVWSGKRPAFIDKIISNREGFDALEQGKVWSHLEGNIRVIITKNSGFIRFTLEGRSYDAFFNKSACAGGDLCDDDIGREVLMDVERQPPIRGVCFKATLVWNAGSPRPQLHQEEMSKRLDDFLEPVEVTESIKLDQDIEELPFAVESVVQDVLREDHGRKILSNPLAIDSVLNRLQRRVEPFERSQLKVQFEKEIRLLLSKFLAERFS